MIGFSLQIIVGAVLNMSLSHEAGPGKKRDRLCAPGHQTKTTLRISAAQAHSFEPSIDQLTNNELSSPPKKYVWKYISYKTKIEHAF
jgi:hypothetical protein